MIYKWLNMFSKQHETYVETELNGGSFSNIILVTQKNKKIIRKEVSNKKYFNNEITALSYLIHPNIVKMIDYNVYTQSLHLEFEKNIDLFYYLEKKNRLTADEFCKIFSQCSDALVYCHNKGFAHLDIKPENILLGENNVPKLADFGFATTEEISNEIRGTPGYIAPEVKIKFYEPKIADSWSLGVTMFVSLVPCNFNKDKLDSLLKNTAKFWKSHQKLLGEFASIIEDLVTINTRTRFRISEHLVDKIKNKSDLSSKY